MSHPVDTGFKVFPPGDNSVYGGRTEVVSVATGAAAVATSLWTMTKPPEGPVKVIVEATTVDAYVRFKTTGAAGTTTSNGMVIPAGTAIMFWLDPSVHKLVDHITAGSAGLLKWYVCSPVLGAGKAYAS